MLFHEKRQEQAFYAKIIRVPSGRTYFFLHEIDTVHAIVSPDIRKNTLIHVQCRMHSSVFHPLQNLGQKKAIKREGIKISQPKNVISSVSYIFPIKILTTRYFHMLLKAEL
jgi:hypothetical protein